MLSCTCIIILQASLNYMPHHVLLFNILSGTTIQLGILNKKGNTLLFGYTACCVWIQSPLTGAPSRLLNYILYKCFKVFHLQSCLLYNVRVGLWLVFPVSQNFPCYSELIFLKKSNEREEWKEQKKQKKLQRFRSLILGHFFFLPCQDYKLVIKVKKEALENLLIYKWYFLHIQHCITLKEQECWRVSEEKQAVTKKILKILLQCNRMGVLIKPSASWMVFHHSPKNMGPPDLTSGKHRQIE